MKAIAGIHKQKTQGLLALGPGAATGPSGPPGRGRPRRVVNRDLWGWLRDVRVPPDAFPVLHLLLRFGDVIALQPVVQQTT